ncbi:glycoside hydrolase family 3 C-terminal domain-containing protein [Streptomyces sp. NPDC006658]|uniref:glycoside hydrolase family 3 C-terminal domain-containing protein n=1 Tax=Streptomyces sp. NPDC006658 TaxID=3156900 RepID=UPI0033DDBAB7
MPWPRARRPGDRPCTRATRALLRRAVAAGSVLVGNADDVLPLDPAGLSAVAVIGTHADTPRVQGGGSAGVRPSGVVTPLDGIRSRLRGRARVVHVPGPSLGLPPSPVDADRCAEPRSGAPGVLVRLLDARGRELHSERRLSGRQLEPTLVPGAHTVEISALLRSESTGEWSFGVGGFGPHDAEARRTSAPGRRLPVPDGRAPAGGASARTGRISRWRHPAGARGRSPRSAVRSP